MIDINDLIPKYQFGDSIALLVLKEDFESTNPICVQVDLDNLVFDVIQPIGHYLKFGTFTSTDLPSDEFKYQDKINRKFTNDSILKMLMEFTNTRFPDTINKSIESDNILIEGGYKQWL